MIDGVFSSAVQAALALALPGVYVGEPQDDREIPGKAVLMELQTDIVVGSPLQRGTLYGPAGAEREAAALCAAPLAEVRLGPRPARNRKKTALLEEGRHA